MAAPLKTAGLRELEALRKRVKRQFAMERIGGHDAQEILTHLDQIEAIIVKMREEGLDYDD
jgi:muramoyltetrapeptide carboxypeptidase LdcA involved in peptidoglycan recycling